MQDISSQDINVSKLPRLSVSERGLFILTVAGVTKHNKPTVSNGAEQIILCRQNST